MALPCFLRAARQRAEQAHIIVVNHALLMTDLAFGGGLIPEYSHVIIDEAHHLEEAATNQFGFELPQGELERIWEPAARLATTVRMDLAAAPPEGAAADTGHAVAAAVEVEAPRIREAWEQLFAGLEMLHSSQRRGRNQGDQNQLLITPDVRRHSAWDELHLALGEPGFAPEPSQSRLQKLAELPRNHAIGSGAGPAGPRNGSRIGGGQYRRSCQSASAPSCTKSGRTRSTGSTSIPRKPLYPSIPLRWMSAQPCRKSCLRKRNAWC